MALGKRVLSKSPVLCTVTLAPEVGDEPAHLVCVVQDLDEIKAEDWTLNISRYVLPPLQEDIPPLPEAIESFKSALTRCREAEDRLAKVMVEGGWLQ